MTQYLGSEPVSAEVTSTPHGKEHDRGGNDETPVWPVGMAGIWLRPLTELPYGFFLCDGNNGTEDMTDLFVVGAGGAYAEGDTGGAAASAALAHTNNHVGGGASLNHNHDGASVPTHGTNLQTNIVKGTPGAGQTNLNITEFNGSGEADHDAIVQPTAHAVTFTQPTGHADHAAISTLPPFKARYWVQRVF